MQRNLQKILKYSCFIKIGFLNLPSIEKNNGIQKRQISLSLNFDILFSNLFLKTRHCNFHQVKRPYEKIPVKSSCQTGLQLISNRSGNKIIGVNLFL